MRIESIAPAPKISGGFTLTLEGGACVPVTEVEMLAFGLYAGLELDEDTLENLKAAVRANRARRRAADLLSLRPMARQELMRKLVEKGVTPDDAATAADDMERLGFINDAEFAVTLCEHYARKGYGPRRIQNEFYRRGIAREHWPAALEQMDDPTAAIDTFLRTKLRGSMPDEAQRRRLSAALARRGFSWDDIRAALRRLGTDTADCDMD